MKVQFNTDKTISGSERNEAFFTTQISEQLDRFASEITRAEVHLSDENGDKKGPDDKNCVLEVRLQGRQPIAVSHQGPTIAKAVSGALDKMKKSLDSILKISHRQ
jgi:ribosome-associated translation inhibitor RaiA